MTDEIYYDPYSYEIDENPYPVWKRMRDEAPLYRNDTHDFWALGRFADVHAASVDWQTYSSSRGTILEVLDIEPELLPQFMIFMDPPQHDRLRKVVSRGFSPRAVSKLEDRVRELAGNYLDQFSPGDSFDFIQDFGAKLPMMVIGSLVGIPEEDQDMVRRWSDNVLHVEEGETSAAAFKDKDQRIGAGGLGQYFKDFVAWKRENPGDDLVDAILSSEIENDDGTMRPLSNREILDFISLLAGAGNETVARLMGWAGSILPRHPDQLAHMAAHPESIPAAVEELLRYEAPSPVQARVTLRPVEVHGTTLEPGSKVLLLTGSAGRDDRQYENPDEFDIHRNATMHLTFGFGPHFCVGASLARLEGRVALEEMLKRFPSWEVDFDRAERVHTSTVRGYIRLPVTV